MIHTFMQMAAGTGSGSIPGGQPFNPPTTGSLEIDWTTGTAPSTSSVGPINVWYRRNICKNIYFASELTNAGVPSGANFFRLYYDVQSAVPASRSILGFNLRIYHTQSSPNANSDPTVYGSSTLVYSDGATTELLAVESTGIQSLNFTTDFTWDGTNDIVIESCMSQNQGGYIGAGVVLSTFNLTQGVQRSSKTDSAGNSCGLAGTSAQTYRPCLKMDWYK